MRDPERIRRILKLLERIWIDSPDLRLGQILCNGTRMESRLFYYEDDKVEVELTAFLELLGKYQQAKRFE